MVGIRNQFVHLGHAEMGTHFIAIAECVALIRMLLEGIGRVSGLGLENMPGQA